MPKVLVVSNDDTKAEQLRKSNIMTFSFDEGVNVVTQSCEIHLYVHFWNPQTLRVEFVIGTVALLDMQNRTNFFSSWMKRQGNLIQNEIAMDAPNVKTSTRSSKWCNINIYVMNLLISALVIFMSVFHGALNIAFEKNLIKKT